MQIIEIYYRMGKFIDKRFRLVQGCSTSQKVFDSGLPYLNDNTRPTQNSSDIYCMGYVHDKARLKSVTGNDKSGEITELLYRFMVLKH